MNVKTLTTLFVASLCSYNSEPIVCYGYTVHAVNDSKGIDTTNPATRSSNTTEAYSSGQWDSTTFCNTLQQPDDIDELSDEEDYDNVDEEFTETPLTFHDLPEMYSSFEEMRINKKVYVDKTKYLEHFVENTGMLYRYARPRRFGKTMLLQTMQNLFQGNQTLFIGTAIYKKGNTGYGNWTEHPVIKIDFSTFRIKSNVESLEEQLHDMLRNIGNDYGVATSQNEEITSLIHKLNSKLGEPVVVLIDEYDYLFNEMQKKGTRMDIEETVDFVNTLFRQIKGSSSRIKFALLIGCGRYELNSLSSGPNNFKDLTFHSNYTTLLGFTKEEIEDNFNTHIEQFAKHRGVNSTWIMEKLHHWYDGYTFFNEHANMERVFNPISVLQSIGEQNFKPYWSSTGSINEILSQLYTKSINPFENITITKDSLCRIYNPKFPVPTTQLMVDNGYLTIIGIDGDIVTLRIPNKEIKDHLQNNIDIYVPERKCFLHELEDAIYNLKDQFNVANITEAVNILNQLCFPSYKHTLDEAAAEREVTRRMIFIFGDIIPYNYCQLENVYPVVLAENLDKQCKSVSQARRMMKKQKKIKNILKKQTAGDLDIVINGAVNYAIEIKCGKINQGIHQTLEYFMKYSNIIEEAVKIPIHYILVLNFNKGKNTKITDWVLIPCNNNTICIDDSTASSSALVETAKQKYTKIAQKVKGDLQKHG